MEERTDKIISFLKEIEKLKNIERVNITSGSRKENSAEHSWHVAMFLLLFEKELPKDANMEKMLKMALIHDLVEIYAGDTYLYDKSSRKTQEEREQKAAQKLFSKLPEDLKDEFFDLFNEFEECKTKEARIVKSFDKIQPILQNICTGGKTWDDNNIKLDDLESHKRKYMLHDKTIQNIYEKLLEEAKKKKLIK